MNSWSLNNYDTLTTRPDRGPRYYLARHLRRRGLLKGPGNCRLTRFREIAKHKPVSVHDIVTGRLDRIFVAEYHHYVWRVRPLCAYCGAELTRKSLTRDHVIPRSQGGGRGDNLVPSCAPCNRAKGDRSLLDFLIQRPLRLSA